MFYFVLLEAILIGNVCIDLQQHKVLSMRCIIISIAYCLLVTGFVSWILYQLEITNRVNFCNIMDITG